MTSTKQHCCRVSRDYNSFHEIVQSLLCLEFLIDTGVVITFRLLILGIPLNLESVNLIWRSIWVSANVSKVGILYFAKQEICVHEHATDIRCYRNSSIQKRLWQQPNGTQKKVRIASHRLDGQYSLTQNCLVERFVIIKQDVFSPFTLVIFSTLNFIFACYQALVRTSQV